MIRQDSPTDALVRHQVFPSWSISFPDEMETTFVEDGQGYWHAYDFDRSISLTGMSLTKEDGEPVPAEEIVREMQFDDGEPFAEMPPGLIGRAFMNDAPSDSRAGRLLAGMVAVDGRLLLVTITCDDESWSREIWLSIRYQPVSPVYAALARIRHALDSQLGPEWEVLDPPS